jgi:hypothetical protein
MGGVEVLKHYRNSLFVYKTDEIKWKGRQFIYLAEMHRALAHPKYLRKHTVADYQILLETDRMLTELEYLRSQVVTAVLLTIQDFCDVTPCL